VRNSVQASPIVYDVTLLQRALNGGKGNYINDIVM